MYQNLKTEIKEIIEIVNQCPKELQQKCFELLLENYLSSNGNAKTETLPKVELLSDVSISEMEKENKLSKNSQTLAEEISLKDFHVKVQRFLQSNSISMEVINNLYYKEKSQLMPLYETLKSTSMAECQIRLALLTAFENSYSDENGDFSFNCEVVRERSQAMKCYNAKNFATYFKENKELWENWPEKYDRNATIMLSAEGKKELAKILIDLAEGE